MSFVVFRFCFVLNGTSWKWAVAAAKLCGHFYEPCVRVRVCVCVCVCRRARRVNKRVSCRLTNWRNGAAYRRPRGEQPRRRPPRPRKKTRPQPDTRQNGADQRINDVFFSFFCVHFPGSLLLFCFFCLFSSSFLFFLPSPDDWLTLTRSFWVFRWLFKRRLLRLESRFSSGWQGCEKFSFGIVFFFAHLEKRNLNSGRNSRWKCST